MSSFVTKTKVVNVLDNLDLMLFQWVIPLIDEQNVK